MLFLISLLGCNPDHEISVLRPEIAVVPAEGLAFGEQVVQVTATQTVSVSNAGKDDLQVSASVEGDGAFSLGATSAVVEAGGTWSLDVHFTPPSYLDYSATLRLISNDEDTPILDLPLTGVGIYAPLPDIEISPLALDFGVVEPGSATIGYLLLRNTGDGELELGSLAQSGSGAFTLTTDPSGNTLAPGSEVPVLVSYAPTQSEGDRGALRVPSNDPDEGEVEVLLLGNGGGDLAWPVAAMDCASPIAPPVWVELSGAASSDPEGNTPLTYQWELGGAPEGSQAALTQDSTVNTRFFADSAGIYEVSLVVTNRLGLASAPARCTMQAVPEEALHVELTWDTPAADLDLHLLQEEAEFFERPGDCNFCNPTPSWGASGTEDDPRLALDDRGGYGPENVKIYTPASGKYKVRVHYFDEHGDDAVVATVKVYLNGALAATRDQVLHRNQVWDAGEIRWPAATFGEETTPLWEPTARTCW